MGIASLAERKAAFVTHLESEKRASPHTVEAYSRDLDALLGLASEAGRGRGGRGRCPAELDVYLLRGWLGDLARRCKPSSVARKIASVRAFCRWMKQKGLSKVNPAAELALPKSRRDLPTFLSAE